MRRFPCVLLFIFAFVAPSFSSQMPGAEPTGRNLYESGLNALTGIAGVNKNDLTAIKYIRRSAEMGYAPAQVALGYFYQTGTILVHDPGQAVVWYRKAAEQDDVLGEWLLGRAILLGNGTLRDLNEAEKWLLKAAEHQEPFSQYLLGLIRLERNDYTQAAEWFRKAANQGLPQAQRELGELLEKGKGVPVDKFKAYMWFLVSFDGVDRTAALDLQRLEADLGSNQVDDAKTKARDLESSVARAVVARGCTGWPGEFNQVPSPPPPDLQRFCR